MGPEWEWCDLGWHWPPLMAGHYHNNWGSGCQEGAPLPLALPPPITVLVRAAARPLARPNSLSLHDDRQFVRAHTAFVRVSGRTQRVTPRCTATHGLYGPQGGLPRLRPVPSGEALKANSLQDPLE